MPLLSDKQPKVESVRAEGIGAGWFVELTKFEGGTEKLHITGPLGEQFNLSDDEVKRFRRVVNEVVA